MQAHTKFKYALVDCVRLLGRFVLSLRYSIRVSGLDTLRDKRGLLIMPNHPAEIDPVLLEILLWRVLRPTPVVLEDFYHMPVLRRMFAMMRALPMPDMEAGRSEFKVRRINGTLREVAERLARGDNVLLYPSGRLSRNGREIIGGASGIHTLLQQTPDATIVLVRTRGLWGSSFSWVYADRRPSLVGCALHGAKALLMNLIFFTPRRKVTIEFETAPDDFPRAGGRAEINQWLENWYNAPCDEPLSLVPYCRWTMKKPEIAGVRAARAVDVSDVPEAVRAGVSEEFARMLKRPPDTIKAEMELRKDLGLDSLEMADMLSWPDERFDATDVSLVDLTTVGAVMVIAAGGHVANRETSKPVSVGGWKSEKSRPPMAMPEGPTIQECFLRACDRMAGASACADDISGALTYKRLKTGALALASVIKTLPGERVGIMLPASVAADVVLLGTMLAGKIPVMINWTLGARNLRHVIRLAEIETILTSMRFVDNLDNVAFDEIEHLLVFLEDVRRDRIGLKKKISALIQSRKSADKLLNLLNLASVSSDDTAVVLFTSGSETVPKGVLLSHGNILANIRDACSILAFQDNDALYGFLPPFHSFGLTATVFLPLLAGIRVAYYPNPTESRKLARGAERWHATLIPGTPSFLKGIIKTAREEQLRSVRIFVTGAEKAPPELFALTDALGTGAILREGYGITECSPVVSLCRLEDEPEGVGKPLPNVEARIVDVETHHPLPQGEQGLILVRGPTVFSGYMGENPPNPFIELDGRRWYNTGDLGYITANGAIVIAGRLKRFVKVGGEMISLPAIEEALAQKWPPDEEKGPAVTVCATEVEGKRPVMYLLTTEDISVDTANDALREAGFSNVSRISIVRRVDIIPLLGTGKTDYRTLQGLLD